MAFAKFQGNRFRIDGEIAENMWSWLSIFNVTLGMIMHSCRPTVHHFTSCIYPVNMRHWPDVGSSSTMSAQHRANASCLCQLWGSLFAVVNDNDWSTG